MNDPEQHTELFAGLLADVHLVHDALGDWITTGPRPDGLAAGEFPVPDCGWLARHTGLAEESVFPALVAIAATGAVSVPAPGVWRFTPDSGRLDAEDAQERVVTVLDLFISCGVPGRSPLLPQARPEQGASVGTN